ncbi:phage capsid family protein [Bartonella sp. B23]
MFFIQICGYAADSMNMSKQSLKLKPIHYGFNRPTARTSKRIIQPNGIFKNKDLTDPQQHNFILNLIDQTITHAKRTYASIHPIHINNKKFYALYLHSTKATQLQNDTRFNFWKNIQNANERISHNKNNHLFEDMLGIYRDVILRKSTYVTNGIHSKTTQLLPMCALLSSLEAKV